MNGKLKIRTKVESLDSGSILSDEELAWKLHAELNTGSPRRPRRTREKSGLGEYLKAYLRPTVIMLPFNIISELSRTLALAVRLFGNMMSGTMILAILLTITPFIFPIVMSALGLLTGMVQAYIFSILATVYIAAATRVRMPKPEADSTH